MSHFSGGLLVWVFSSTPESKVKPEEKESTDTEQVANDEKKSDDTKTEATAVKEEIVIGKGSLEITDQKAGDSVTLGKIEFPTKSGWVVVRDLKDETKRPKCKRRKRRTPNRRTRND